jgi:hypothetical protein
MSVAMAFIHKECRKESYFQNFPYPLLINLLRIGYLNPLPLVDGFKSSHGI